MSSDATSVLAGLDQRHRDALVVLGLDEDRHRNAKHWWNRSSQAGVEGERGRQVSKEAFTVLIDHLLAIGAARRDGDGDHSIVASWLAPVLEDAQQRGRLASLALGMRARGGWMDMRGLGDRGELLVALASANARALREALRWVGYYRRGVGEGRHPIVEMLGLDVPRRWIEQLEPTLQVAYLQDAAFLAFTSARRLGEGLRETALASEHEPTRALVGSVLALAGETERAHAMLDTDGASNWMRAARGFLALVEGKQSEARERFAAAALGARGQRVDLPSFFSVFDVLLAVTSDDASEVSDVARRIDKARKFFVSFLVATDTIEELSAFRKIGKVPPRARHRAYDWPDDLFAALGERWMRREPSRDVDLAKRALLVREQGYAWLADEIERVRAGVVEGSLLSLFGEKEGWELVLDSLRAVVSSEGPRPKAAPGKPKAKTKDVELWWTVAIQPDLSWVDVDPFATSGVHTKGKKLSLRRLLGSPGVPMTDDDQRIAERLSLMEERGHSYLPCSALLELVGHPRVRDLLGNHLTVETGETKLRVAQSRKGARVVLVPSLFDRSGTAAEREGDRLVVYTRTPVIARIAESLPPKGLEVPQAGLARMSEILGALGQVIGIETSSEVATETAAGDPRLRIQLFRATQGMRVRLRVVPIASGPALRPGVPPADTVVHRDGELVRVARDLAGEKARVEALLERCPTLASLPQEDGDLVARDLETCLELLVELRETETDAIVEWLEGQPLRAPSIRSGSHVRIRVKGDSKWLQVEGEVRIDEERLLGMRELLDAASRARGRFVPIGEDEWLALTDDIKKKLDALGRVQALDKSGRVSATLLPAIEALLDGFDVSFADAVDK